jgi:hypothetical protein
MSGSGFMAIPVEMPNFLGFVMPVLVTGIHDFGRVSEGRGWPAFAGHDVQEMLILRHF